MKKRILIMFMSLLALTPAVFGSGLGENKRINGEGSIAPHTRECELRAARNVEMQRTNVGNAQAQKSSTSTAL